MMKKGFMILAMLVLGCTLSCTLMAQKLYENGILYHSFCSPYATRYNPATFISSSSWYVTLPNADGRVNLPLSYNDLGLTYDSERDVTVIDANHVIDQLKNHGTKIDASAEVNLFGFGVKMLDLVSFHLSTGLRANTFADIPTGVLDLLTEGNMEANQQLNLGGDNVAGALLYSYLSLGAGVHFDWLPFPINFGARANIFNGIQALVADNITLDLTTANDISYVQASYDYLLHSAGITQFTLGEDGNLSAAIDWGHPCNYGFSFDLGAKVKFGPLELSASVLDLGGNIYWTDNAVAVVPEHDQRTITFEGVDFSSLLNGGSIDTSFLAEYRDTLMSVTDFTSSSSEMLTTLPSRAYLGASLSVGKLLRLGYLLSCQWYGNNAWETLKANNSLSAHINLFNWLELSAANSLTFDGNQVSWFNPGAAVTLSPAGSFQIFAGVDYLSSMYLADTKSARVFIGINIVGNNIR